jgi:LPPG:FO 2-phospho-L-lactate transferase
MEDNVLALAGGVGGAKLVLGLARILPPEALVIAVNTGDDECFHGLHVSPDLDTVMYTLAGLANPETGWGLSGDTFIALSMLERYNVSTWFRLGDRDLATHIRRTQMLRQGCTLSQVTAELCHCLGVAQMVVPMSDDSVRTVVGTEAGELPMQQYFVQHHSEPKVVSIRYEGAATAQPAPGLLEGLARASTLVFCPSNPFLSLGPILAIPGVRERLQRFQGFRVAVSPIVGGMALRGPAAKIMAELGYEASSIAVARQYVGLCDTFWIDHQDAHLAPAIAQLGMKPMVGPIVMTSEADKVALARRILGLEDE